MNSYLYRMAPIIFWKISVETVRHSRKNMLKYLKVIYRYAILGQCIYYAYRVIKGADFSGEGMSVPF